MVLPGPHGQTGPDASKGKGLRDGAAAFLSRRASAMNLAISAPKMIAAKSGTSNAIIISAATITVTVDQNIFLTSPKSTQVRRS